MRETQGVPGAAQTATRSEREMCPNCHPQPEDVLTACFTDPVFLRTVLCAAHREVFEAQHERLQGRGVLMYCGRPAVLAVPAAKGDV